MILTVDKDQFLWCEKYRPKTIDDCILPETLKETFKGIVVQDEVPNMTLAGGAGTGKTTVARALCNEMDMEYLFINASEDSGIDTLRTKIRTFASSVSLNGNKKVVILDEADFLQANSTQVALRGFIEEFSKNCRFILTCNFKNRIIDALHSRCPVHEFRIDNKEKPQMAAELFKRMTTILDLEGVSYKPPVLVELIKKHFPDFRRIINELQRYSVSGTIDEGILSSVSEVQMADLMKSLKNKEFTAVRKWVVENSDNDPARIYRKIYDSLAEKLVPKSIPTAILILADYSYKHSFACDSEINLVAALVELMSECEFK